MCPSYSSFHEQGHIRSCRGSQTSSGQSSCNGPLPTLNRDQDRPFVSTPIGPQSTDIGYQTPRIPYSYYCCYCFVTKSALWQYLGNQAWYHRSAGVKTTGKKFWIRKFKIQKKKCQKFVENGQKWSKMVKNGQNGQNGLKWSKMVPNGPKWFKMVQNGEKRWKMVNVAKNGQNHQKWSKSPKMVKMV